MIEREGQCDLWFQICQSMSALLEKTDVSAHHWIMETTGYLCACVPDYRADFTMLREEATERCPDKYDDRDTISEWLAVIEVKFMAQRQKFAGGSYLGLKLPRELVSAPAIASVPAAIAVAA